jgi:hypothetical protein
MTNTTNTGTPTEVGAKYIRWGLGLFVFGLIIGYGPWLHYMHGAMEEVQPAFLHNVTLWFGCPWTLAVYVAQLGSLAMIVIGLCYVVFAGHGAMTSVTGAERIGPVLCATGILTEFVFGYIGYFGVNRVWPSFYYVPINEGKWTWLGLQGICIAIFLIGVICAHSGIKRATKVLAHSQQ